MSAREVLVFMETVITVAMAVPFVVGIVLLAWAVTAFLVRR